MVKQSKPIRLAALKRQLLGLKATEKMIINKFDQVLETSQTDDLPVWKIIAEFNYSFLLALNVSEAIEIQSCILALIESEQV